MTGIDLREFAAYNIKLLDWKQFQIELFHRRTDFKKEDIRYV